MYRSEIRLGWISRTFVKPKLVTRLCAEEELSTTEEMHPDVFACGGGDFGDWRKGDSSFSLFLLSFLSWLMNAVSSS